MLIALESYVKIVTPARTANFRFNRLCGFSLELQACDIEKAAKVKKPFSRHKRQNRNVSTMKCWETLLVYQWKRHRSRNQAVSGVCQASSGHHSYCISRTWIQHLALVTDRQCTTFFKPSLYQLVRYRTVQFQAFYNRRKIRTQPTRRTDPLYTGTR